MTQDRTGRNPDPAVCVRDRRRGCNDFRGNRRQHAYPLRYVGRVGRYGSSCVRETRVRVAPGSGRGIGERDRVGRAAEAFRAPQRPADRRLGGIRECDQVPGEVATVDGRDVGRKQWLRREGVVPVEKMAAMAFETFKRVQGRFHALDPVDQAGPAEFKRAHR